jgi:hypothetical protein
MTAPAELWQDEKMFGSTSGLMAEGEDVWQNQQN